MDDSIEINGRPVDLTGASDRARGLAASIAFVDGEIRQLKNEWAVADTARLAYLAALQRETRRTDAED